MRIRLQHTFVLLCLLNAGVVLAQNVQDDDEEEEKGIISKLEEFGLQIRKAFDGGKQEAEAARFSYSNPNNGDSFYLVDLAVKVSEWEVFPHAVNKSMLVYPTFEWHRSTSEEKQVNKFSVGPRLEYFYGDLLQPPHIAPFLLFSANLERDAEKETTGANSSILLSLKGISKPGGKNSWLPMSNIRTRAGSLAFRYYYYAGVDYLDNLAIEEEGELVARDINLTSVLFRLQLELFPFNFNGKQQFEIVPVYTYRRRLGGSSFLGDDFQLVTVSANLYLDSDQHFALGYDYESGRNPKNNLLKQNLSSVSLKIKF